ncbi:MAG: hypothetical protein ACTH2Y_02615 [Corynebacterium sp.]|uniref:hypothetical protein n=1 Tax=unclassified Corynebacterium TaxID=2624378 RepID=UPI00264850B8|nr:hypothetical protein [Corynebacterium sp.]MDN5582064.1 hypothetical protein [Corynebacterium sp.]MDN5719221.1 hypothetical protein [Corynebacterium sp.]MDN6386947.1 hypothetical protein [Corynebacterium sp.]MDN6510930.1 hypothetical protein [Corynebacterium sp.]
MPSTTSITRRLVSLFDWYRRPSSGDQAFIDNTVLGVLPGSCTMTLPRTVRREDTGPNTRVFSPSDLGVGTGSTDVLALLIDEGRTPATPREVRYTFRALEGRHPTDAEASAACSYVASFGLLA